MHRLSVMLILVCLGVLSMFAWAQEPPREAWYRERFLPTLEPLLELDVERVLVTHGAPVLSGGRAALRAALQAPPWLHHG